MAKKKSKTKIILAIIGVYLLIGMIYSSAVNLPDYFEAKYSTPDDTDDTPDDTPTDDTPTDDTPVDDTPTDDGNNNEDPVLKTYYCYKCEANDKGYVLVEQVEGWGCMTIGSTLYTNSLTECQTLHPEYYSTNTPVDDTPTDDTPTDDTPTDDTPTDDTPTDDTPTDDTPTTPPPTSDNSNEAIISFDGFNDYVEVADADVFSIANTGKFTVSFWMRPNVLNLPNPTSDAGYTDILGKGSPSQHEWGFRWYNKDNAENRPNRLAFYVWNLDGTGAPATYWQPAYTEMQANTWYHVVGVADGSRTHLYVNGVKVDTDLYNSAYTPANGISPMRIGTKQKRGFFDGEMADVLVWNDALTATEVQQIYTRQCSGFSYKTNSCNYMSASDLVAWYGLDDTDSSINDDSNNAYQGTFYSGSAPTSPKTASVQMFSLFGSSQIAYDQPSIHLVRWVVDIFAYPVTIIGKLFGVYTSV